MDTKDKTRKTKPRLVERTGKRQNSNPDVKIVYTQAKPFNRNRFLLRLATIVAVVLALLLGVMIFFKVDKVTVHYKLDDVEVSGTHKYGSWQIMEASGLEKGDNLLFVSASKIAGRITTKLPYIQEVRVEISLPDTVKIEIVEADVTYAIEAENGEWWLIDSGGKVLEQISAAQSKAVTKVLGVQVTDPAPGQSAVAAEPIPEETNEDGTPVPVVVHGSEQLQIAVSILQYLEANGILGEMASIDVSYVGDIQLWLAERYQILLGDATQLDYKIAAMKMAIDQSGNYQSGILDVSFTTWPDKVGYTPF